MITSDAFNKAMTQIRLRNGVTMAAIAKKIGVPRTLLDNMRRGSQWVSVNISAKCRIMYLCIIGDIFFVQTIADLVRMSYICSIIKAHGTHDRHYHFPPRAVSANANEV